MADSLFFNQNDAYTILNSLAQQLTANDALTATDTSSFLSVGSKLLAMGENNVIIGLSQMAVRTIYANRPHTSALARILRVSEERYGAMTRKITFLQDYAEESENFNTDLNPNMLDDGQSVDMYKIQKSKILELHFYGAQVMQKHITVWREQLYDAFQSEDQFLEFISKMMQNFNNEIEILEEAKTRALLLGAIAGTYEMRTDAPETVVDLVAEFNTEKGTTYTREVLLQEHYEEFVKFVPSVIKIQSQRMVDLTSNFHYNMPNDHNLDINRETPKDAQKLLMYAPFFTRAETEVYSALYNPNYLEIENVEKINFWQSAKKDEAMKVNAQSRIIANGEVAVGTAQEIPYVFGILFDEEFMGVAPKFTYTSATPFNSAGGYWNNFYHGLFRAYLDYTENHVLFVLGAGGE